MENMIMGYVSALLEESGYDCNLDIEITDDSRYFINVSGDVTNMHLLKNKLSISEYALLFDLILKDYCPYVEKFTGNKHVDHTVEYNWYDLELTTKDKELIQKINRIIKDDLHALLVKIERGVIELMETWDEEE